MSGYLLAFGFTPRVPCSDSMSGHHKKEQKKADIVLKNTQPYSWSMRHSNRRGNMKIQ